jgi:CrcB protein
MKLLLVIALGGGLGASARYLTMVGMHRLGAGLPWGTFVVNVAGSLVLGVLLRVLPAHAGADSLWRGFLTVGLLGAFTTFSTFSYDALLLLEERAWGRAALYMGGSVALGVGALVAGLWLGGLLERA